MIPFLIVEGFATVLLFVGVCITAVDVQRHFFQFAIPFTMMFYLLICNSSLRHELKNANVMGQPMTYPNLKQFGEFSQVELGVVE